MLVNFDQYPMKSKLHILTDAFPFGGTEQFFEIEVLELAKKFDSITLYPLVKTNEVIRKLPDNVEVNLCLANANRKSTKKDFIAGFRIMLSILILELWKTKRKLYLFRNVKRTVRSIFQCIKLSEVLNKQQDNAVQNYYYSFWMNDGALILAILKKRKLIRDFNFRVNGFDIFDERQEGLYMPFRFFNYKMVKQIFVLSSPALSYLKNINYYPEKLILAHYGIYDLGTNQFNNLPPYEIVSCANMIPLKRIDKIISALKHIDFHVRWTHYGDGALRSELEILASDLPENVDCTFKGSLPNKEIIKHYQEQPVALFIHTSETEGLGMAIIEAQSFGIPAVVIGVGGVIDIVDNSTGYVLKENANSNEIAKAITKVVLSNEGTRLREQAKTNCLKKFNAKRNYEELFQLIIS